LCNIASSRIISFSLGAKKKESTNVDALCICEGDCISVENHGKHWIHLGHIISIDTNTKTTVVKWEETWNKDTVHLGDCKKYNKLDVIPRKHKSTVFFCEIPHTKRGKPPPGQMKNMFFFNENLSKLCAEGAIKNLLNMMHFSSEDMNNFWELDTSDLNTLMKLLNKSFVPKAVLIPSLGIDSIQKCLWILHKKFKFQTTKKINYTHFQFLKQSLKVLLENKYPMLISVESKFATYHHVVVVWREMVIDYESMYTYPLTEDTLRQICIVNTAFQQISCEYGILLSTICKAFEANQNIQDWGIADLYKPGSSTRDYFYWR
jgi:hypothetical protein